MKKLFTTALLIPILIQNSAAAEWPMFRGNEQRTGFYPDLVGFPDENGYTWKRSFGYPIVSSPSIADNTLYIGMRDSCIYAIDAISGSVEWKVKTSGWIDASPLLWEKMCIVGGSDGHIYVLDTRNGTQLTLLTAGYQLSSPAALRNGTIISGMGPPFKQCAIFNPGSPRWDEARAAWSIPFLQMSYSSPSLWGNIISIGASDGRLYTIDLTAQDTLWSFTTGGGVDLSTPAIDTSTIYFAPGNYDKSVYAVDLKTGKLLWASIDRTKSGRNTRNRNTIHPLKFMQLLRLSPAHRAIAAARLRSRGIHAPAVLDTPKRRLRYTTQQFYPYGGMKTSSVAVGKKRIFVVQKELGYPKPQFSLIALDKWNGRELWRFSELRNCVKLGYCSSPVVTRDKVFVGWGEGKLYALDTETGKKLWEDSLSGDIISSPAIANGNLYVATMGGDIYSYRLAETAPGLSFKKSTYCYPNPARSGYSKIQVYVSSRAEMKMVIYNAAEKPVFRLKRSMRDGEKFTYKWNLKNVANGIYFAMVQVKYSNGDEQKKLLKIAVLH